MHGGSRVFFFYYRRANGERLKKKIKNGSYMQVRSRIIDQYNPLHHHNHNFPRYVQSPKTRFIHTVHCYKKKMDEKLYTSSSLALLLVERVGELACYMTTIGSPTLIAKVALTRTRWWLAKDDCMAQVVTKDAWAYLLWLLARQPEWGGLRRRLHEDQICHGQQLGECLSAKGP